MKLDNLFKQASIVAENSHDTQTQVGCLLVKYGSGSVISSGFNGFVRGAADDQLPTTRPDKYQYIIHAETNLICNAALNGVSTENCFVVCTMSPCKNCCRLLFQAGIRTIYFKDKYRDFEDQIKMEDLQIILTQVGKYYKINMYAK